MSLVSPTAEPCKAPVGATDPLPCPERAPSRPSSRRADRQRRTLARALTRRSMGDGLPGLCLAAAYLAESGDCGLGDLAVCHLGAVDHLLAALTAEVAFVRGQGEMGAGTLMVLAWSLQELAELLARTAESMATTASEAAPGAMVRL